MLNYIILHPVIVLIILTTACGAMRPVILVPGLGGSRLECRLNRSTTAHGQCLKHSDWFTLWINIEELVFPFIPCFADNMKLFYNETSRKTSNNEGVDIRVPGWGTTETIERLDSHHSFLTEYFEPLVKALVAIGYKKGVDLHGAPYDFRKGLSESASFFSNLTDLVESTYENNSLQPVIMVAHSMGCPFTLHWLHSKTDSWKKKYIRWFVPLNGVWAGSLKALRSMISGENVNIMVIDPLYMREFQRTSPSFAFLLPSPMVWDPDEILIETKQKNYTVKDYDNLFVDMEYPEASLLRKSELDAKYQGHVAPQVPVYAFYGNKRATPARYVYKNPNNWSTYKPTVIYENNGDGTVNERSLRVVNDWKQKQNLTVVVLDNAEHLDILRSPQVINTIKQLVTET